MTLTHWLAISAALVALSSAFVAYAVYSAKIRKIDDKEREERKVVENWRTSFFAGLSQAFAESDIPFLLDYQREDSPRTSNFRGQASLKGIPVYLEILPTNNVYRGSFYQESLKIRPNALGSSPEQMALESLHALTVANIVTPRQSRVAGSVLLNDDKLDFQGVQGFSHGLDLVRILLRYQRFWNEYGPLREEFIQKHVSLEDVRDRIWAGIKSIREAETADKNSAA